MKTRFDFGARVAVKVCGVTTIEDAETCARFGVDIVGLNFSPTSKRYIATETAAAIIEAIRPSVESVRFAGVFVDQEAEFVQQVADDLPLDAVQLHGDESPSYIATLRAPFVIKALRVSGAAPPVSATAYDCDALLLDTWTPNERGGSGQTFPWSIAAQMRGRTERLILAGGLTAENVNEAIDTVHPFAVDVCSSVEGRIGRKSAEKVRRFVEQVRRHDSAAVAT